MRTLEGLHQHYQRQAAWTTSMRQYHLNQLNLPPNPIILEVGCGTGAIVSEMVQKYPLASLIGLDVDADALHLARKIDPESSYLLGNGYQLPFSENTFDLIYLHFVLLWNTPIQPLLLSLTRCLKPGAALIAFAEPDFGGRIDYPAELEVLCHWQIESLQRRGGNPLIGRELAHHFHQTGLKDIRTNVMGGEWTIPQSKDSYQAEWDLLLDDLSHLDSFDETIFNRLKALAEEYAAIGTRIFYVPTFSAIGFKPLL